MRFELFGCDGGKETKQILKKFLTKWRTGVCGQTDSRWNTLPSLKNRPYYSFGSHLMEIQCQLIFVKLRFRKIHELRTLETRQRILGTKFE